MESKLERRLWKARKNLKGRGKQESSGKVSWKQKGAIGKLERGEGEAEQWSVDRSKVK